MVGCIMYLSLVHLTITGKFAEGIGVADYEDLDIFGGGFLPFGIGNMEWNIVMAVV